MPFPSLNVDKPLGTDLVSEVDDYERETRQWVAQCLNLISGYPSVETVAIKAWNNTEGSRPRVANKILLGFNTDTNELEIIKDEGGGQYTVSGISKQVILSVYPVGSYYETSDATFNPNTEWGGTWVLDTPGRVMVSQGRKKDVNDQVIAGSYNFEAGEIGGEETHCLARPELPSVQSEIPIHYHPHRHPHSHDVAGFLEKIGQGDTAIGYLAPSGPSSLGVKVGTIKSGLPTKENYAYSMGEANNTEIGWFPLQDPNYTLHGMVDADTLTPDEASAENPRTVSEDLIMHVGSSVGQNGHNNLQPYKVCYRWHRTA